jgi:hypothetical protein
MANCNREECIQNKEHCIQAENAEKRLIGKTLLLPTKQI